MVNRDLVTSWLVTVLTGVGTPVGDHQAPDMGGWSSGTPGQGDFVPYVVVSAGQGVSREAGLCPGAFDWTLTYTVKCFSVSRKGVDQLADAVCGELVGLPHEEFGSYYRSNFTRVNQMSAVVSDSATNPKTWSTQLTLTLDVVATNKR